MSIISQLRKSLRKKIQYLETTHNWRTKILSKFKKEDKLLKFHEEVIIQIEIIKTKKIFSVQKYLLLLQKQKKMVEDIINLLDDLNQKSPSEIKKNKLQIKNTIAALQEINDLEEKYYIQPLEEKIIEIRQKIFQRIVLVVGLSSAVATSAVAQKLKLFSDKQILETPTAAIEQSIEREIMQEKTIETKVNKPNIIKQEIPISHSVYNDRGIKHDSLTFHKRIGVLRDTKCPTILVEPSFISNKKDITFFVANMDAYALKIADGLIQSLSYQEGQGNFIIIDPGHGPGNGGAGGNGYVEDELVLQLGEKVRKVLKAKGVDSQLTREFGVKNWSPKKHVNAINLLASRNKGKKVIAISIHLNAAKNKKASGFETYYTSNSGKKIATQVHGRIAQVGNRINNMIAKN